MKEKERRVVVVTGASAGVGRASAKMFGSRGDKVALLARGGRGLAGAAAEIESAGGQALPIEVDMADYEAVQAAAQRTEDELGPIDVWVNDAFGTVFGPFRKVRMDEFRRATDVTYMGYVHGTRAALDRMAPRDAGTIVQVGSALAYRGIPLQAGYCGSKHAIQGFTEALRCELMHEQSKVHVTMVQLPAVNTPQFDWALSRMPNKAQPVPPIYQPEVAAKAIVHAADHPSRREYWVGASTVGTMVANKFAPGLLDRYLGRTGYQSQQTDQPEDPDRAANLWEPLDDDDGRDFGARGRFSGRSRSSSPQLWLSQHHVAVAAVAGAVVGGLGWAALARR